jgi:outer membrane protein
MLSIGPGYTWANNRYAQTFFGVDAQQSARSGLPQFEAHDAGSAARLSMNAVYLIARRVSLGGFASYSRLQGDARHSPITQDRSQYVAGAFVAYRFGSMSGAQE